MGHNRYSINIFCLRGEKGWRIRNVCTYKHTHKHTNRAPIIRAFCLTLSSHPVFSNPGNYSSLFPTQTVFTQIKSSVFSNTVLVVFFSFMKPFDCADHNKLWTILKEMGIPDHLTCLLRNLYAGQKATVRTGHGTTGWFQIGKGVCQSCILSPCLFSLYAEYIMRNAGLEEAQAGIEIAGRLPVTSDMQMSPPL